MRDSEVVASIVAGDPGGLAAAYDRYADPLHRYCRSMLSDPADAADAVQDTFVIAASRLAGLHDPERLRGWLYAVARNECLRILRARKPVPALDEARNVTDAAADVSEGAERAELRLLFEEASRGLNPGEREAIELQLRQGLEPAEVAAVLGVSGNHAHSLLSRARAQLEACLGVLLAGRAGRDDCGELGSMLAGWDGRLTVLLRKRVHRHIERCAACAARRASGLRPASLFGLSAGAALAAGAAESSRVAAAAPAGLKAHALALAGGQGPTAVAHQAAVLGRAGSFGRDGFPRPLHQAGAKPGPPHGAAKAGLRSSSRGQAAAAAAVVVAVLAAALAVALTGNTGHVNQSGGKPPAPPTARAAAGLDPGNRATAQSPAPPATASVAATSSILKPAPTTAHPAPPPATTSPAAIPTTTSPAPAPTPTPTPTPASGTVSVFGAGFGNQVVLQLGGAWIWLVASGGPVDWSITVAGDPGHHISVSPSSGTLARNGASAFVHITADQQVSGATLTIQPGGAVYTVVTVWGRRR